MCIHILVHMIGLWLQCVLPSQISSFCFEWSTPAYSISETVVNYVASRNIYFDYPTKGQFTARAETLELSPSYRKVSRTQFSVLKFRNTYSYKSYEIFKLTNENASFIHSTVKALILIGSCACQVCIVHWCMTSDFLELLRSVTFPIPASFQSHLFLHHSCINVELKKVDNASLEPRQVSL